MASVQRSGRGAESGNLKTTKEQKVIVRERDESDRHRVGKPSGGVCPDV